MPRRPVHQAEFYTTIMRGIALIIMLTLTILASCSRSMRLDPPPLRLDPHRQELQRQQDECLARGGNPKECRP